MGQADDSAILIVVDDEFISFKLPLLRLDASSQYFDVATLQ